MIAQSTPFLASTTTMPAPGSSVDIIRGTQQARLAREIIVNLALVPDVVAAGEHVEPVAEQLIGKLRRNAEASGRIFSVGDRKIDFFGGDDFLSGGGRRCFARAKRKCRR